MEKRKITSASVVAMLIEGDKVAFAPKDINDWPKDFFEVLVRSNWRKWVEAVKKEIEGWDDNRAVELVNIEDVPASAKIIHQTKWNLQVPTIFDGKFIATWHRFSRQLFHYDIVNGNDDFLLLGCNEWKSSSWMGCCVWISANEGTV